MKNNLTFDFVVNKETSTINVKKEFEAGQSVIWDAFTKPEFLDKWWAPHPFVSETKTMEFKEGGKRLYAMCGPNGEKHWAFAVYTSITPQTNFEYWDGFCDENGEINDGKPRSDWSLNFSENNGITTVDIAIKHKTLADLEKIIGFGFKEGFMACMEGLDKLL